MVEILNSESSNSTSGAVHLIGNRPWKIFFSLVILTKASLCFFFLFFYLGCIRLNAFRNRSLPVFDLVRLEILVQCIGAKTEEKEYTGVLPFYHSLTHTRTHTHTHTHNHTRAFSLSLSRAARIITFQGYGVRSAQIRKQLNWEDLASRRQKHLSLLMYDVINKNVPSYISDLFSNDCENNPYKSKLRNKEHNAWSYTKN